MTAGAVDVEDVVRSAQYWPLVVSGGQGVVDGLGIMIWGQTPLPLSWRVEHTGDEGKGGSPVTRGSLVVDVVLRTAPPSRRRIPRPVLAAGIESS